MQLDLSVHQFDVLLYQIQSDTGTFAFLRGGGSAEHPLENQWLIHFSNAHTVIRHNYADISIIQVDTARDSGIVFRILAGIREQVIEYGLQFDDIRLYGKLGHGGIEHELLLWMSIFESLKDTPAEVHYIESGENQSVFFTILQPVNL